MIDEVDHPVVRILIAVNRYMKAVAGRIYADKKCAGKIETGMVVDTTMPNSILAEAFRKCHDAKCPDAKQLRELAALAFPCVPSQIHPLPRLDADLHAPSGLFSGHRLWGLEVRR